MNHVDYKVMPLLLNVFVKNLKTFKILVLNSFYFLLRKHIQSSPEKTKEKTERKNFPICNSRSTHII